ncbi:MAG: GAF domain-containing protein, partial [bacterium]
MAISTPFLAGITILVFHFDEIISPMAIEMIWKLPYVLILISFVFAILKYRLMDIDLIIKKTIIYSAVTGLIVLLYLGLVGGLGGFLVQYTGLQNQWMVVFSTLAVALVFVPLRNRVQEFIDRRFYRKKHDYPQLLKQLGSDVHEAADQKTLLQCIAENLQQALPNRATVIFLKSQSDQNFWAKAKIGLPDEVPGRLKITPDSPMLAEIDGILQLSHYRENLPEADRRIMQQIRADLLVPVKAKRELIGLISLGKKLSDLGYDEDDREYLLGVAEHLAIGLEHVRLREQEKEFEQAREI